MTKPTAAEIRDRFAHHPPKGEAVTLHELIRAQFGDLAHFLNESLPDSREAAHAQRALQEAAMWSNAAVAIHISGAPERPTAAASNPHWETDLRVERALKMQTADPLAHIVVVTRTGQWTIMHSAGCRELGHIESCDFTQLAAKTDFTGWPSPCKLGVKDNGGGGYLVNAGTS